MLADIASARTSNWNFPLNARLSTESAVLHPFDSSLSIQDFSTPPLHLRSSFDPSLNLIGFAQLRSHQAGGTESGGKSVRASLMKFIRVSAYVCTYLPTCMQIRFPKVQRSFNLFIGQSEVWNTDEESAYTPRWAGEGWGGGVGRDKGRIILRSVLTCECASVHTPPSGFTCKFVSTLSPYFRLLVYIELHAIFP